MQEQKDQTNKSVHLSNVSSNKLLSIFHSANNFFYAFVLTFYKSHFAIKI